MSRHFRAGKCVTVESLLCALRGILVREMRFIQLPCNSSAPEMCARKSAWLETLLRGHKTVVVLSNGAREPPPPPHPPPIEALCAAALRVGAGQCAAYKWERGHVMVRSGQESEIPALQAPGAGCAAAGTASGSSATWRWQVGRGGGRLLVACSTMPRRRACQFMRISDSWVAHAKLASQHCCISPR